MASNKERTNMQTLQGKLCVALYENLGDVVLPVITDLVKARAVEEHG